MTGLAPLAYTQHSIPLSYYMNKYNMYGTAQMQRRTRLQLFRK